MKPVATILIVCVLLLSCDDHSILEGNTAGQANYYVHWFTKGDRPKTCFINEGRTEAIEEQSMADQAASFRYDLLKFQAENSNVVIATVAGAHVETVPINESIYLLSKGRYTKIKQTKKIRKLMKQDHEVMGEELIAHLKATGKL